MKSFLRNALDRVLFVLSCAVPRSKRRWAFIGWHIGSDMEIFADNTKYLFLQVAETRPDIHAVWLAKDRKLAALLRERGFNSFYQHSPRGIYEALRAGTTVIDAFLQPENFRWSGRTRLVQLLHGRGMKKGGYGVAPPRPHDFIFCPSPFIESLLPQEFTGGAQVIHSGYPRNDVLFRAIPGSDISEDGNLRAELERARAEGLTTILYAPTFRRGEKEFGLASKFDFEKINAWLERTGRKLFISLHPKYRDQGREARHSRITFVEESEIYPLLPLVDLLVADYSSLIYDYLLLDRPIVFFPYDLDTYSAGEGLAFPYETYTPGPKARDSESLMAAVDAVLANDPYAAERARVRDMYHTHADGCAAGRIIKILAS